MASNHHLCGTSLAVLAVLLLLTGCSPSAVAQATPTATPIPLHTYSIPATIAEPDAIVAWPYGPLWLGYAGGIARVDIQGTGVAFTPFPIVGGVSGLCTGPDGSVWFTEARAAKIGRITPQGSIQEFALPDGESGSRAITRGPDGALWFTLPRAIGRISTSGEVTTFPLPSPYDPSVGTTAGGITAGPDGAIWFTDYHAKRIGRMTLSGVATEFPVPSDNAELNDITTGPDGSLWFPEGPNALIGRITTTGQVSEFTTPEATINRSDWLSGITAGPDKALWFAESDSHRIGRITTEGIVTHEYLVSPGDRLGDFLTITSTANAIWFVVPDAHLIGRIDVK